MFFNGIVRQGVFSSAMLAVTKSHRLQFIHSFIQLFIHFPPLILSGGHRAAGAYPSIIGQKWGTTRKTQTVVQFEDSKDNKIKLKWNSLNIKFSWN